MKSVVVDTCFAILALALLSDLVLCSVDWLGHLQATDREGCVNLR
jgi:hypothetical protein